MKTAAWPREQTEAERLLVVDPAAGKMADFAVGDLPSRLRAGDLLVVNDAATLPASLQAHAADGAPVEVRLLGPAEEGQWVAAVLGAGNWRWRTEDRPAPPTLPVGSTLTFRAASDEPAPLRATVVGISEVSPRLLRLTFDRQGDALWSAVYRRGRPVQYSYVRAPLALWHVQTAYASRPWAAEAPSAGRPLTWRVLLEARRRGIALAAVTHAAGLSSTGEPALDAALPLPERFDVPEETVAAVTRARAAGGRVVAVGTTVVRALEGAAEAGGGHLRAGEGRTSLRIDRAFRPRIVNGLLTGVHQPGESHFDLLQAFAPEPLLRRALAHAEQEGYLAHEFGDSCLILPRSL
ncbi:MAG TPA: S-adenosylmethionine:tRNA ribosyltransferase-isomerase [Vicinamibacteria bacterium]|nr:S-adenosylmethionine:tRNA ribosyltransferase-isomerase [Vicinamibacteria bacterium]